MILECKPIFYSHKIFILNIINSLIIYFLFIRINALTLLVTIISLSDSNQRNEGIRLKEIYSLFDFNKVGDISCDELTVLLTTIHASYGFILNTKSTIVNVPLMVKSAEYIYKVTSKQVSGPLNANDLLLYCTEKLFNEGVFTIEGIHSCLLNGLSDTIQTE